MGALLRLRLMMNESLLETLSVMSQCIASFSSSLGGLPSGLLLAFFFSKFQHPILLMLFPAILTLRGDIGGILSSKLGTFLHTGRIIPQLMGNTKDYKALIQSIFAFTIFDMYLLSLFGFIVNLTLGRATWELLPLFILIPVLTGGISVAISEVITATFTIYTFRKGLDPDIIVYPIMSIINDVIVTVIYFGASFIVLSNDYSKLYSLMLFAIVTIIFTIFVSINYKSEIFHRIFKEATPVIIVCLSLGTVSGIILTGFQAELGTYPGILIIYPVLMSALGSMGAITGATTSTQLFLGELDTKIRSVKKGLKTLIPIEIAAFILHLIYAVAAFIISRGTGLLVPLENLILITLSSNVLTFPIIFLIAYFISVKTFQRGLDPDNFVIPLETSIADLISIFTVSMIALYILN